LIVDIIIPALNEEVGIVRVLRDLPRNIVRNVIVVDNGSSDQTAARAREAGAVVVRESERGYGAACLCGLAYIGDLSQAPDAVCFLDGDHADDPGQLPELLHEMESGADFVLASRAMGRAERGSLTLPQRVGNWIAVTMIRMMYGVRFTDLGPFRVIRYDALRKLKMRDRNYGWTAEMQVKAAKSGLRCVEIPARYRNRVGVSKVSGTVKGSVLAGYKIILTIVRYA
jgi:glycosyltransferase involved in cell wall biosynthesis